MQHFARRFDSVPVKAGIIAALARVRLARHHRELNDEDRSRGGRNCQQRLCQAKSDGCVCHGILRVYSIERGSD